MEIKTCEQYVVESLMEAQNRVEELTAEVSALQEQLAKKNEEPNVVSATGVYYITDVMSTYKYNEVLKSNNKTPEWLRTALTDDQVLNEWLAMETGSGWYSYKVSMVQSWVYNYLFTALGEHMVIRVDLNRDDILESHYIDNKTYWLSEEDATNYVRTTARSRIEDYFEEHRDEKFQETE